MSNQPGRSRSRGSNIFINYRRDDSAGYAGRLFDKLSARFGESVFMDVDYIAPGLDFVEVIEKAVGSADVLIVVIGKQWLTITDSKGNRRLDNPDDFVRVEVEAALKRNIRVIPVLVEDALMPHKADLPAALEKLARRNALELSDARWSYDVERLIETLEEVLALKRPNQGGSTGGLPSATKVSDPVEPQPHPSGKLWKAVIGISAAILLVALGSILAIALWKKRTPEKTEVVMNQNVNTGVTNVANNNANPRVTPTVSPSPTASPTVSPKSAGAEPYCLKYNPRNLRVDNLEDGTARVMDGDVSVVPRLDNEADGKMALAVASQHTARCFIGRGNRRPEPRDYLMSYWTGGSVKPDTVAYEDCISYDPRQLRIEDEGERGWLLTSGNSRMLMLDNKTDAEQALAVARQYTAQCFIGRNNKRAGRKFYIIQYWK